MPEAICWARRQQPTRVTIAPGNRRIVERIPQTGTYGDYDAPVPAPVRWRRVIDSYGNDLRVVLTTAAAELDTDGSYGRHQRAKWLHFGWFEIGRCPVAMFLADELRSQHFSSPDVLREAKASHACAPRTYSAEEPCPHAVAEIKARREQHAADEAERLKGFQTEAQKLAAIHKQQNDELLLGLADKMGEAIKAAAGSGAPPAAAPAPKDKGGK